MDWTRTETLALAAHNCTHCHGLGLRIGRRGTSAPCNCVLRAIFRACYARFRYCATKEKHMSRCSLEFTPGRERKMTWSRKDEEYVADFIAVTRRTLEPEEYQLFNFHLLLGADWKMCCRRLKMDRGSFFHAVYRIEQKLGKTFRELEPYCLFPLDEYFHSGRKNESSSVSSQPADRGRVIPIRPPVSRPRVAASTLPLLKSA
jgi:hypothetical protein